MEIYTDLIWLYLEERSLAASGGALCLGSCGGGNRNTVVAQEKEDKEAMKVFLGDGQARLVARGAAREARGA